MQRDSHIIWNAPSFQAALICHILDVDVVNKIGVQRRCIPLQCKCNVSAKKSWAVLYINDMCVAVLLHICTPPASSTVGMHVTESLIADTRQALHGFSICAVSHH